MKPVPALLGLAALCMVTACGSTQHVTRALPFAEPLTHQGSGAVVAPSYDVTDVRVHFTPGMKVSESNGYYPIADIVWRGDPYGDRFEQVSALMQEGLNRGVQDLHGSRPVVVDVTVTRFHSLTERTRYTVGGTHSIHFDLAVRDAGTGALIDGPRAVDASFPGLGGLAALAAEQRGQTQKVRISARLAQVIGEELSRPVEVAALR